MDKQSNIKNKSLPTILFFIVYGIMSSNFPLIGVFMLVLFFIIFESLILGVEPNDLQVLLAQPKVLSQLSLNVFTTGVAQLGFLIGSYVVITRLKTKLTFFSLTFILFLISYWIHFAFLFPQNSLLALFLIGLLYIGTLSYTLIVAWDHFIFSKHKNATLYLLIPIGFSIMSILLGLDFIFLIYTKVGLLINQYLHFNIFWFDYSGFVIIFVNFVLAILLLILTLLLRSKKSIL